mmetsp:Transcript_18005/g.15721  ORF Transcript_18005/g.15721 Transcript_18005/m.15721 type:complete len:270 (+) Transcript_18005:733-1542(+)
MRFTENPALQSQLNKLQEAKREEKVGSGTEIKYHGEQIPIKNEKMVIALTKIRELKEALDKFKHSNEIIDESDEARRMSLFIDLFSAYDDASKLATKEKEENKSIESLQQIYILMENYFKSEKLQSVIERNRLQISNAVKSFVADIGFDNVWHCKKNTKHKTTFPQDIVKLYDNLLQFCKSYLEIESSNPDFKIIKMIELTETTFKTIRNFYVACTHFSYGKLVEGYSLLLHFEELYSGVQTMQKNYDISLQSADAQLSKDLDFCLHNF